MLTKGERVVVLVAATVGVVLVAMTLACSLDEADQQSEPVGVELTVDPAEVVDGDEDKIEAEEAEAEALPPIDASE